MKSTTWQLLAACGSLWQLVTCQTCATNEIQPRHLREEAWGRTGRSTFHPEHIWAPKMPEIVPFTYFHMVPIPSSSSSTTSQEKTEQIPFFERILPRFATYHLQNPSETQNQFGHSETLIGKLGSMAFQTPPKMV